MCAQCRWIMWVDSWANLQFTVFHPSGGHEDVPGLEATLLVEKNEEGYSGVCSSVPKLSAGEVWASKTGYIALEAWDSTIEMGADYHGFYSWAPTDFEEVRCYLGDCGSADEVRTLHSNWYYLLFGVVGWDLHPRDCLPSRCASVHHFRPGHTVYLVVSESNATRVGHPGWVEHYISPSDGQIVWAHYSDIRGHARHFCHWFWGFMGSVSAAHGVYLQQQLPIKHSDGYIWGFVWETVLIYGGLVWAGWG